MLRVVVGLVKMDVVLVWISMGDLLRLDADGFLGLDVE